MKIERITVCNIASLAGTHSVDFTQKPLKTAGLFSISGATGAGKSTLLDALCLALFDQTPRLQAAKTSRAELNDGEKQHDTRMLLRRNTARGFAEVAFVGVDRQRWTARWSVRRSRNSADGSLQKVDMTLYHGHIAPGSEGRVAEGGKKTQVKEAIVRRIGLTFEQFTRAVLLAQNDFATFLKATDQERAAILQALTGTEHFEAISKAVYARCSEERKAVEILDAQLAGQQPLTEGARSEADAALLQATGNVTKISATLKQRQAEAEWFRVLTSLQDDLTEAKRKSAHADEQSAAAADRRATLKLTETAGQEARDLRGDEQRAAAAVSDATAATALAEKTLNQHKDALQQGTEKLNAAKVRLKSIQQEQNATEPLLNRARELDAKLEPLQTRVTMAQHALTDAQDAVKKATEKRDAAVGTKQTLTKQQKELQSQIDRLKTFEPFLKEAATWKHRLDTAIDAEKTTADQRATLATLTELAKTQQQDLDAQRIDVSKAKTKAEEAAAALGDAEAAEKKFDAEALANRRDQLNNDLRVLTNLQQQLTDYGKSVGEAKSLAHEIQEQESRQASTTTEIERLRKYDVPLAERDVQLATQQLNIMQAAVDDHAKRLRLSLQDQQPCPVCGSEHHPYSDNEPDSDATAINAARQHLDSLQKQRDDTKQKLQTLSATLDAGVKHLTDLRRRLSDIEQTIVGFAFTSARHPAVASVLALAEDDRVAAVIQQRDSIEAVRNQITEDEKALRAATKRVQQRRGNADELNQELRTLQDGLTELEKQHGVTESKMSTAAESLQKAERRLHDATNTLGGLFSGLPDSKEHFTDDAVGFRDAFVASTGSLGTLTEQLQHVAGKLKESTAAIGPLQEAADNAAKSLTDCEQEHTAALAERDEHLNQRRQLFDGRGADTVQQDIAKRARDAQKTVDDLAAENHATENLLAAAQESHLTAVRNAKTAAENVNSAAAAFAAWLDGFCRRTEQTVDIEAVDQMLNRDAKWIEAEREYLRQLDEAKTATSSGMRRVQQTAEHACRETANDRCRRGGTAVRAGFAGGTEARKRSAGCREGHRSQRRSITKRQCDSGRTSGRTGCHRRPLAKAE